MLLFLDILVYVCFVVTVGNVPLGLPQGTGVLHTLLCMPSSEYYGDKTLTKVDKNKLDLHYEIWLNYLFVDKRDQKTPELEFEFFYVGQ